MEHDRHDEYALRHLDDMQLEAIRSEMIGERDERLELVIRALVLRAVPVIERVCRKRGTDRALSRAQISNAIEDASVRMLLRLKRLDRQPAITALAAEIAAACIDAQQPTSPTVPRLAARRPDLRLTNALGDAVKDGRVRPNDWSNS